MNAPPRQTDRAFGFTFAVVFVVIAIVVRIFAGQFPVWAIVISVVFFSIAITKPILLLPFNRLWGRIAALLGAANNYLLLGLFFFVFIVPAGIVAKLRKYDPLERTLDRHSSSYWRPVTRHSSPENLRDQF